MSKILITYFSKTGNTKTIAEAIYNTIEIDKIIMPLNELQDNDLEGYSLIFIGFPVHSHSIPFSVEKSLKKIPPNQKIAFFSTHGSLTGSRLAREALEYATVMASKAKLLGTFTCRGKVSPQAMEFLEKFSEHKAWVEMVSSADTHPDENDLQDAASFASWIMTLAFQD